MRKADNLPPSCAVVTKYGNLNFLEPSGPVQACNRTVLPLPLQVASDVVTRAVGLQPRYSTVHTATVGLAT